MKLKVGDVFTIPVSDDTTGFGQIVKIPNKSNFIIIVFKRVYSGAEWPSIEEVVSDEILFLGFTMDALLYHKYWRVIGNISSNLLQIKLPYFKRGTPPDMTIVDFNGNIVREAKKDEFDRLEYLTVVAPVGYEIALQAYYKLGAWEQEYDELLYEKTLLSIKVVEMGSKHF